MHVLTNLKMYKLSSRVWYRQALWLSERFSLEYNDGIISFLLLEYFNFSFLFFY